MTRKQIDDFLRLLDPLEKYDDKKIKWPISRKIYHAKKVIKKISDKRFDKLIEDLNECLKLFKHRNEVMHNVIRANFDRPDTLESGRPNFQSRQITPDELYNLASKFEEFRVAIYAYMVSKLPKAINNFLKCKIKRESRE